MFSFEAFAAGSYTIGRGYDPGVLSGDSGVGFATELRYDRLALLPSYGIGAQPYAFVDTEWVWNRNTAGGHRSAAGDVGGRRRAHRLVGQVAARSRRGGAVEGCRRRPRRGDVRVLMSLTARLLPWSAR